MTDTTEGEHDRWQGDMELYSNLAYLPLTLWYEANCWLAKKDNRRPIFDDFCKLDADQRRFPFRFIDRVVSIDVGGIDLPGGICA